MISTLRGEKEGLIRRLLKNSEKFFFDKSKGMSKSNYYRMSSCGYVSTVRSSLSFFNIFLHQFIFLYNKSYLAKGFYLDLGVHISLGCKKSDYKGVVLKASKDYFEAEGVESNFKKYDDKCFNLLNFRRYLRGQEVLYEKLRDGVSLDISRGVLIEEEVDSGVLKFQQKPLIGSFMLCQFFDFKKDEDIKFFRNPFKIREIVKASACLYYFSNFKRVLSVDVMFFKKFLFCIGKYIF
jgi:hypothetical protein